MFQPKHRHGVPAGLALACALAAPGAMAQDAAPATTLSQEDIEEIIVTGSRIARPELTAMSPFAVIGEEQIALSNQNNIENVLRNSPQFAQALGSATNNGNEGSATIDLRNLGEERTLVLVNGKRFVPYDYQGYVDLSMIPTSLIERVEVITGGASAVYGADAVAGVVNFILKDKFEGLEVSGSMATTEEGDGDTYDFSVTAGGNFAGGRGNLVFNLGYTNQGEISQADRPYSFDALGADTLESFGSFTAPEGTILYPEIAGDPFAGCAQFDPTSNPVDCTSTFNFNRYNLFQVPQQKWTATALGSYEITDDLEFFVRGSFANNRVDTIIAPTGTFFEPFKVNLDNPLLTPATQALLQSIEDYENSLPGATPDGLANVSLGRRFTEFGTRDSLYENTAYQFVGGLRGTILDDQDWEVFGQYGRTSRSQTFVGDNNKLKVQESLIVRADGLGNYCDTNNNGSRDSLDNVNCVPANLFGVGNLDPAAQQFLTLNLNEVNKTDQLVFGGSLSGDLPLTIPLADSSVSYAAGVEFRREQGNNAPDDNYVRGVGPGFGSSSPVDAEIEIKEVFAELLVPLVSGAPLAQSINFETGIRYGKYDNAVNLPTGSSDNTFYNTSYKFGADWSPVDALRFNVMYQRAVRAPTLREIGLPKTSSTGDLSDDPCDNDFPVGEDPGLNPALSALCEATGVPVGQTGSFISIIAGQIGNFLGGNPELRPEEADTWTVGFDWTPAFLEGLSVSVDYYDIQIDDAITELTEQDIVNACYQVDQNANGPYCSLITRSPLTGSLNAGSTVGVYRQLDNIGSETASGIDFDIRYAFDLADAGSLDIGLAANYAIERKTQLADFLPEYDCTGNVGNTCLRPNPEWTFIQTTTWTVGPATLQLQWHYVDSVTQDTVAFGDAAPTDFAVPTIASQSFFDLTGAYDIDETWTLRGGITNLFDRDPPIVGNDYGGTTENSGNTYPATYPSVGRGYYVGVNAKF